MPEQLKLLTKFYNEHYKLLTVNDEVIYYDKLNFVLAYEAIDIVKNINVNISEHFIRHFVVPKSKVKTLFLQKVLKNKI